MKKRKLLFLSISVFVLLLVSCTKIPAGTGSISGTVLLQGQSDHSNITVQLNPYNLSTKTNTMGTFSFTNLPDGAYTVTFSKSTYKSATKTITVQNGNAVEVPVCTLLVENPTSVNPVKARLFGHSCYFDFDQGAVTTDWTLADLRLDAFSIYQTQYLLHLDEASAILFEEEYGENWEHTFNQFEQITSTDYPLEFKSFNFYIGDVMLLKTTEDKYVKLLIYDYNNRYGEEDAPSVDFVYLYDQIVDTTKPTLLQIKLYTEDGSEYTQTPAHGQMTFQVNSRPVRVQFIFDEFVKSSLHNYTINDNHLLYIAQDDMYIPYYDTYSGELSASWFTEPGIYTLSYLTDDYYYRDLSGNLMTTLPFSSIVIDWEL